MVLVIDNYDSFTYNLVQYLTNAIHRAWKGRNSDDMDFGSGQDADPAA